MESKFNPIEPLLERAAAYGKTKFELLKLKALGKTAEILSSLLSRMVFILVTGLLVLTLNIALSLWLGERLGKAYYGFLAVAALQAITGVLLWWLHPVIKRRLCDSIIKQMFN